jgi:hypothetical protein
VLAQGHHALARIGRDQPLVDERFQRDREHERAQRCTDEEQQGQRDARPVRAQEGCEAAEGAN